MHEAVAKASPLPFVMLGEEVPPATLATLPWSPTDSFTGTAVPADVHGDELNGIETVRRVLHGVEPQRLRGTLVGVPIVNLQGFHRNSRYLSDRRDLNRYFPGNPTGSSASRIAYSLFSQVIER